MSQHTPQAIYMTYWIIKAQEKEEQWKRFGGFRKVGDMRADAPAAFPTFCHARDAWVGEGERQEGGTFDINQSLVRHQELLGPSVHFLIK